MLMLKQLAYWSRSRISGPADVVAWNIRSILVASRARNARLGVTGAMIFHGGYFGQVLEGSDAAVNTIFRCIERDERHGEITLLGSCVVGGRAFDGWSMALAGGPYGLPLRRQPAENVNLNIPRLTAQELRDNLVHLANETEKAGL